MVGHEARPIWIRLQIASSVILLVILAASKFVSIWTLTRVHREIDPLLGIAFEYSIGIAALMELSVALAALVSKSAHIQAAWMIWLSGVFCLYRFGLWWIGYSKPCACMGSLTGLLEISPDRADLIAKTVLAYLITGNCAVLAFARASHRPKN